MADTRTDANQAASVEASSAPILKIGHVAALVGVSASRIRLWEQQELISPRRTPTGQRQFSLQDVKRLERIRRSLDSRAMTVVGLRRLLRAEDGDAAPEAEQAPETISVGQRVNALRRRRKRSLRSLSDEIGVSASALSALERGMSKPSLGKLTQIAHALGTTTPELLGVAEAAGEMVVRADARVALPLETPGVVIENLYKASTVLQSQLVTVEPGCGSGEPMTHVGEDFLVVLEGQVDVTLDGLESFRLRAGDSMTFESARPHSYENRGSVTSRVVWVNTPPTF